jgi:Bax protein
LKKLAIFILGTLLTVSSFAISEPAPTDNSSLLNTTAVELLANNKTTKKENFTSSMVAIIDDVKNEIEENKAKLHEISKAEDPTPEEKSFASTLFTKYRVTDGDYQTLIEKMILPPTSLILAQASLESGWGHSNLSKKGNNLFGMKSFDANEPRVNVGNINYRKYDSLRDSVKDYIVNLSRHNSYKSLREAIKKGEDSIKLTKHLSAYCEDPAYGKALVTMINNNNFMDHDV